MKIRAFILLTAACAIGSLSGCSRSGNEFTGPSLPLDAPLPRTIPPGTRLVIGDPVTRRVLEHNHWLDQLHFTVQWAEITGGPAVTEAFHGDALDVGLSADIPPIHSVWVGIPVKIIAVQLHRDPINDPIYFIGIAPHAGIKTLADLRGKRIAYSPGQVQGEIVLRTLREEGLTTHDVTLVNLPSEGATYVNALLAGSVDAAPIHSGALSKRYIDQHGAEGARVLRHGPFRDDLTVLYVREETLHDPAKAAALREYVTVWARAMAWIETHHDEWAQFYWVGYQGLSPQDARREVDSTGARYTPSDWSTAVDIERSAIALLAPVEGQKPFDASRLFDRRFEAVIAGATAKTSAVSRPPSLAGTP